MSGKFYRTFFIEVLPALFIASRFEIFGES